MLFNILIVVVLKKCSIGNMLVHSSYVVKGINGVMRLILQFVL